MNDNKLRLIVKHSRYRLIETPPHADNIGRLAVVVMLLVLAIGWGWAALVPVVVVVAIMTLLKTFESLDELREFLRSDGQQAENDGGKLRFD
jgi:hypothetical protein